MCSLKNASQRSHKICAGQTYIKFIKKTSMETVLHPREASAGDVNHLSEKDYQIKKHPVHSMNFPLPYCEIAPRL